MVGDIDEDTLITEFNTLEIKLSREINYIILSNEEYNEKIDNNDPFIKEILHEPKIIILGEINAG
jgi:hypothetical protein